MTRREVIARGVVIVDGTLRAFDHFAAWSFSFQVILWVLFAGFMFGLFFASWTFVWLGLGVIGVGYLLSRAFTIRVSRGSGSFEVDQYWLGIRYRSRAFAFDSARISIGGTGDWGDPGDWPIAELCELNGMCAGRFRYVYIGPAKAREAVARELRAMLARPQDQA